MIKNWYRGSLIAVVICLLMVTQIGGGSAAASSTPFGPERFRTDHATYTISTQSPYYQRVWRAAIKAWNKTGAFHFQKAKSASAAQATATLNPSLLREYDYSRANQLAVAEHELGHVMGLAHNPDKQSVMYYRNRNVVIQPVDIQGVKLRYQTPAGQASN